MTKQELKNLIKEVVEEMGSSSEPSIKKEPAWTTGLKRTNQPRIPSDDKDLKYLKAMGLTVVIGKMGDFVGGLPNMVASLRLDGKPVMSNGYSIDVKSHGRNVADRFRRLVYQYFSGNQVNIEDFIQTLVATTRDEVRQSTPIYTGRRDYKGNKKYPVFDKEEDQVKYLVNNAKNVFGSDIPIIKQF